MIYTGDLIRVLTAAQLAVGDMPVEIVTWWECSEMDIEGVAVVKCGGNTVLRIWANSPIDRSTTSTEKVIQHIWQDSPPDQQPITDTNEEIPE